MVFLNSQMLALFLLLPVIIIIWLWRGMRPGFPLLLLRLAVVSLVVLALANPMIGPEPPPAKPLIVLVDQSDSLTDGGRAELRARSARLVRAWEAASSESEGQSEGQGQAPARRATVFWFGRKVIPPGDWRTTIEEELLPPALRASLDPSASNLADALRLGREMSASAGGRIVFLSDGIPTSSSGGIPAGSMVLREAERAAAEGMQVDVWPLEPFRGPEIRIARLAASPDTVRVGEHYQVAIDVEAVGFSAAGMGNAGVPTSTLALLRLWETPPDNRGTERLLAETQLTLTSGHNSRSFRNTARASGVVGLRAEVVGFAAGADTFPHNNEARATAVIELQPRILVVEGREGLGDELDAAFWRSDIESEVITPEELPTRLSDLQWYEGMVLLDVSTQQLSLAQMSSIHEFVRSEGRGLVVAGGPNSYSLGGYQNTPLEDVLPVRLEPPPRPQRSNVALLLIVDRSASMSIPIDVSKFDMAKEAAILSTEMLQRDDYIGILAFDTEQEWAVPFQPIGYGLTLKQIQDTIVTIDVGGGTDIYEALEEGLVALQQQQASVRHAVILTDGRSFTNDRNAYHQVVTTARDNDITLSAIAIGLDADTELLNNLALWGGGRYYFTDAPADIPRMTIQESEIARSAPMVESDFHAVLDTPHPLLAGFSPTDLPLLNGYVATTRRPGAETVLQSPNTDPDLASPILSTWQYGLGRVVAWTSSATAPWAESWAEWGEYGPFWAQITRYTLPNPEGGPVQIQVEPQPGGARLAVDVVRTSGNPLNLADAVADITLPDGTPHRVDLLQAAPGRYAQDLLLPAEGTYAIAVTLSDGQTMYGAQAGYVHAPPDEYLAAWAFSPDQANNQARSEDGEVEQGRALLERIATITGGEIIEGEQDETLVGEPEVHPRPDDPLAPLRSSPWVWLMMAAGVLWLLDVALQRRSPFR
jgi:Ca-activated chloride channel homolog